MGYLTEISNCKKVQMDDTTYLKNGLMISFWVVLNVLHCQLIEEHLVNNLRAVCYNSFCGRKLTVYDDLNRIFTTLYILKKTN